MSWLAANWHLIAGGLGTAGFGGLTTKLLDYWRVTRLQSDNVAVGLIEKLSGRIEALERAQEHEREVCELRLRELRHQLRNVEGNFDALMLAIEFAPDKAAEVIARVKERRAAKAAVSA